MNNKALHFRVCDFSEQFLPPEPGRYHYIYSATMHVDGQVFHWKKDLRADFCPPVSALRTEGWVALLEKITEGK